MMAKTAEKKNSESFARHQAGAEAQNIGKLIEGQQIRDAVHVAIAPVVAGSVLQPGQHVGLIGDKASKDLKTIGIVDPFLRQDVQPGEKFWLFLYPGTITSLKHLWTHPAFNDKDTRVEAFSPAPAAHIWLREYAEELGVEFDVLIAGADQFLIDGDYVEDGGKYESVYVNDEFWTHYELYRSKVVPEEDRGNFFSCSC
jgi:hypothetical protein